MNAAAATLAFAQPHTHYDSRWSCNTIICISVDGKIRSGVLTNVKGKQCTAQKAWLLLCSKYFKNRGRRQNRFEQMLHCCMNPVIMRVWRWCDGWGIDTGLQLTAFSALCTKLHFLNQKLPSIWKCVMYSNCDSFKMTESMCGGPSCSMYPAFSCLHSLLITTSG